MRIRRGKDKKATSPTPEEAANEIRRHASANGQSIEVWSWARDLSLGGAEAVLGATKTSLLMAFPARPDVVMELRFDQVVRIDQDEGRIAVTQRDPEYARESLDPSNPLGETDWHLELPASDSGYAMSGCINLGLLRASPVFAKKRQVIQALKELQGAPVATWSGCPACGREFGARVEGAASCTACGRVFCDPNVEPVVSQESATYGQVTDVRPPSLDSDYAGMTTTWFYRPKGQPVGPPVVIDAETQELVSAV